MPRVLRLEAKVSEWLNTRFCRGEHSASEQGFGQRKSVDWFLIREKGTFWQPLSHYQEALSHYQEAVQDRKTFNVASPSVIICRSCIKSIRSVPLELLSNFKACDIFHFDMNHLVNRWNRKTREGGEDLLSILGKPEAFGMCEPVNASIRGQSVSFPWAMKWQISGCCKRWGFGEAGSHGRPWIPRLVVDKTPLGNGRKAQEARKVEKWRKSGRKMKGGQPGVSELVRVSGWIPPYRSYWPSGLTGDHD